KIYEIALESGFSDPMYFDHCFTWHYGCSPQSYRKNAVQDPQG
ncbi:MAG: AraC family transcriptional regulator, partial [Lentisphaeria bacterium]|nr:AraC family transcriptional regulator [Lentisphaeria bacterium]